MENKEKIVKFLQENEANFMQSPNWAEVKSDWKNKYIIVEDKDGNIKGAMSVLLRKIPIFNRYIMYAPRGFTCDKHDKETIKELTIKAQEMAKKNKVFAFRLDPDVLNEDDEFKNIIEELGYKTKKNIKDITQVIQPKYVFRLDLRNKTEEDVLKSFESKTRYNVRLAIKKGITIEEGTREDIKTFYEILEETSKRDHFSIRPIEYYQKVYDKMGKENVKILIAKYNEEAISTTFLIKYANKVWFLYGGANNKYRNFMPNHLIQWTGIKWAIESKCDWYDFRGVSGFKDEKDPQHGVYRFKKGFNPVFMEFIDEMYIVYKPITNFLFKIVEKIRSKK